MMITYVKYERGEGLCFYTKQLSTELVNRVCRNLNQATFLPNLGRSSVSLLSEKLQLSFYKIKRSLLLYHGST